MNKDSVSIYVVDNHPIVLEGVKNMLEKADSNWNVTIEPNSVAARRTLLNSSFDLYIFDLEMPEVSGEDLALSLRALRADSKIIIYTLHIEPWIVKKLLDLKVDGIVTKSADLSYLIEGVYSVLDGNVYHDPTLAKTIKEVSSQNKAETLSPKEIEVLSLICHGKTSKEIAQATNTSVNTIETHRKNIFGKLDVKNIAELVMKAVGLGFIRSSK